MATLTTESPIAAISRRLNNPDITNQQRMHEIETLEAAMEDIDNTIDPWVDNMTGVESPSTWQKMDQFLLNIACGHWWKQVHGNQPNPNAESGDFSCKASVDH